MTGMFTYDENLRRLERMEARQDVLMRKRNPTDAELEELGELMADIGEMQAWFNDVQRQEGP